MPIQSHCCQEGKCSRITEIVTSVANWPGWKLGGVTGMWVGDLEGWGGGLGVQQID